MAAPTFVSAAVLSIGICLIAVATYRIFRCSKSTSWPQVDAVIMEARVEVENDDGIYYYPVVKYQYVVNGKLHLGTHLKVSGEVKHTSPKPLRDFVQRYRPGAHVIAYLSPESPQRAYLQVGFGIAPFAILLIGLSFACSGIWQLLSS